MGIDVKYDIRDMASDIAEWCDEVYPTRTRDHMVAKLKEEFAELAERPLDAWEMADIQIILLDLARELGFDLARVVAHKMDINRNHRKWQINEQGILKHVKAAGHPESGDHQALAHRQHVEAPDSGRAPVQHCNTDEGDLPKTWVCSGCRLPTVSLGSCPRCRGVQDGGHPDSGQETDEISAGPQA